MKVALIGNGGQGKEVKSYLDRIGIESSFFVSDDFHTGNTDVMKLSDLDIEKYQVLVCIADSDNKKKITNILPKQTKYFTFIHPSAQVYTKNKIGDGCIISPNVVINTNVEIGNHVLLNYNTTIGHDTAIGNYCTINPNTAVAGNCKIEDSVFIGSGSSIREKLTIVGKTIIGMGSVVLNNILESGTYVGVPVRKIK